jgi:hypothetical protein
LTTAAEAFVDEAEDEARQETPAIKFREFVEVLLTMHCPPVGVPEPA